MIGSSLKINKQARAHRGFREMKITGFGYDHYTLSVWETADDVKSFAHSGAHLQAVEITRELASEVTIYTFESDLVPTWKDLIRLLKEKGRRIHY